MPSLKVFVQCPVKLREGFDKCRASIESSDIGTDYELCMQEPGTHITEHFMALLRHMSEAKTDLVLRLEDDVEVNRHIVHNLTTWPTIHDPRFKIGWAFDPAGRTRTIHDHVYERPPSREIWEEDELAYSLAVLMWTRDVMAIHDACAEFYKTHPGTTAQDLALSRAQHHIGGGLVIHPPSLVEHMLDLPSSLNHPHDKYSTSMGSFMKDWKRGAPRIDSRGRVVGVQ